MTNKEKSDQEVSVARLRIAQVALIGAMDCNRSLLNSITWQQALIDVNRMISEATPADDKSQMVLFPIQSLPQRKAAL